MVLLLAGVLLLGKHLAVHLLTSLHYVYYAYTVFLVPPTQNPSFQTISTFSNFSSSTFACSVHVDAADTFKFQMFRIIY